ncbi:MAG: SoxR reducing system RseC family protein [Candidatus Thiothrix moscowensis]|nr:SoxR reducing system RseC family protein [Candidatus Thiothrix moscowensis]
MIEQTALVTGVEGGYAWVLPQGRNGSCGGCSSSKTGCSSSSSFDFIRKEPQKMRVLNPVYARPGDTVIVGIQADALVLYSLLAYLLPLIGMLLAAVLGGGLLSLLGIQGEAGVVLAAVVGLLGSLRLANKLGSRSMGGKGFQPVILRHRDQVIYSTLMPSP